MKQSSYLHDVVTQYNMTAKEDRQTMMFSATFSEECQHLAREFLFDHIFISIGNVGSASSTVYQVFEKVDIDQKIDFAIDWVYKFLKKRNEGERLLIFSNSKEQAKGLDERMYQASIDCAALHGDLSQPDREKNLQKFRDGKLDVLIATDVASRGLDIPGVSQVLNYDVPWSKDIYVQRIGRTGRIGRRGIATTFFSFDSRGQWKDDRADQLETIKALPKIYEESGNTDCPTWLKEKADELAKCREGWGSNNDSSSRWGATDARGSAGWWSSSNENPKLSHWMDKPPQVPPQYSADNGGTPTQMAEGEAACSWAQPQDSASAW